MAIKQYWAKQPSSMHGSNPSKQPKEPVNYPNGILVVGEMS
uniref:Uncharacterized protein n=1 Tax=Arundo donax TaxID=35708 RepID=A0A0A9ANE2_ARUDO